MIDNNIGREPERVETDEHRWIEHGLIEEQGEGTEQLYKETE